MAGLISTPAHATIFAYEGFSNVAADGALAGNNASGTGFTGAWEITNGSGGASTVEAAGLAYPGGYVGSNVAVGGNGRVTGASGDNGFLALSLDATADFFINGASNIYVSWLAQNVAQSVTSVGFTGTFGTHEEWRSAFNLAAEYPRNSGIRLMSTTSGNNTFGTIGNSGNWTGGGPNGNQSVWGDGELNPEVVDTWGVFNFNDANNIFTGNGGTQAAAGSAFYDPTTANYTGVAHLVLSVDTAGGAYRLQVNPMPDGSNDGEVSWVHTDGGPPIPFELKRFGVEAGNDSGDRPVGDMVFDEITIADTFEDAAGFVQVPEPSIALLGGLGLLGLVRRRRA